MARNVEIKVHVADFAAQTRIPLDEISGLGRFTGFEGVLRPEQSQEESTMIADRLMSALGIRQADLVTGAYADLLDRTASDKRR